MVDAQEDTENVTTTIRLPSKVLKKLQKVAKLERRSQSSVIQAALMDYFQREDGDQLSPEQIKAIEAYLEGRLQPKK